MAKKIQSNICGMVMSFYTVASAGSAALAVNGRQMPQLPAHVHVGFTRVGRCAGSCRSTRFRKEAYPTSRPWKWVPPSSNTSPSRNFHAVGLAAAR